MLTLHAISLFTSSAATVACLTIAYTDNISEGKLGFVGLPENIEQRFVGLFGGFHGV